MACPLRIEYAGAVYRMMARGNQGQKNCADDGDRSLWLATLSEDWRRTGWRIHAWALVSNHLPFINIVNCRTDPLDELLQDYKIKQTFLEAKPVQKIRQCLERLQASLGVQSDSQPNGIAPT